MDEIFLSSSFHAAAEREDVIEKTACTCVAPRVHQTDRMAVEALRAGDAVGRASGTCRVVIQTPWTL